MVKITDPLVPEGNGENMGTELELQFSGSTERGKTDPDKAEFPKELKRNS